jgi:predicted TIM-barrel fold metal-dependent hydrolase
LGIYGAHRDERLDQAYLERLQRDVNIAADNGALSGAVIFPHERIYADNGELMERGQELYVPNDYTFKCAEESGGRMMPAASVHPYRRDALDEVAKWIDRGAVALKWLPNSQNMDPEDSRCVPIYELLVSKKVPLIVHTGGEHVVRVIRPELGDPKKLRPALDRGVNVIMAHCGTKSGLFDTHWMPDFCDLARRYPNCWGDTSAFCTPGRTRWIAPMLREEGVVEKLIHGSDYPVPPGAYENLLELGLSRTRALAKIWSFLERDVRIKQARGFPEVVFTNAARVLAPGSVRRWMKLK